MSSSNWVSSGEMSPKRYNHYQLDGVGLQLGIGLPLDIIGLPSNRIVNDGWQRWTTPESTMYMNAILQTVDGIPIRKVYITNISLEMEREDLLNIFGGFGRIMNIFLRISKNDPYKKFAFVTFANPKAASCVVAMHTFTDPHGRRMYVVPADSWHQPKEGADGRIVWYKTRTTQEDEREEDEDQSSAVETQLVCAEINEESLNVLNDDCLLHIFSFLPLKEIARLESVCKRWQGLSYRMWRCLHKLSFSERTMPDMKAETPTLSAYLRRCGPSLLELDLAVSKHKFDETTLAVVAKHCNNLEVLRVSKLTVGNRSLAHLGRSCPNLKQLVMDDCEKFNDNDLMSLLPKCSKLTLLDISYNINITGRFLTKVESPLTSLHLNNLEALNVYALVEGLRRLTKSLKTLKLCTMVNLVSEDVKRIVAAVPNLTSLTLSQRLRRPVQFDPNALVMLGELKQLTSLDLSHYDGVNDKVLTAIVDGCKNLSDINLSCSGATCYGDLSEEGLVKLGTLRKLRELDISYLDAATDTALKKLASRNNRIRKLVCRGCPDVGDEGCVQVVTLCNDLELFDLSGCIVSNETVSAALTSVKMRTNNIPLRLIVGGTNVIEVLIESKVPLLTVEMADYSEDHLRPDFVNEMFFPISDSDEDEDIDNLCCDCEFDYDDMYDPTAWQNDFADSTTVYADDTVDADLCQFMQYVENPEDLVWI